MRKRPVLWLLLIHAAAAVGILLFPYYKSWADRVFGWFPTCPMHDFLHIYCPLCGGTRAVDALIRFRLVEALRCHPIVVLFCAAVLVYDAAVWVRLLRRKQPLLPRVPMWAVWTTLGLFAGYWILRNLLLVGFGVDPMGDLAGFYAR